MTSQGESFGDVATLFGLPYITKVCVKRVKRVKSMLGKRKRITELKPDVDEPKVKHRKVDMRVRNWFLTWNNYDADSIGVLLNLAQVIKYQIQEEVGKEGTPHLQGVMVFSEAVRFSTLDRACKKKCIWIVCKKLAAAVKYCSKVETASGKSWTQGFKVPGAKAVDPLEGKELYPWQKDIVAMVCSVTDPRKVYWFWSEEGNLGKTWLAKHLALKHGAIVVGGSHKDAFFAIAKRVSKDGPDAVKVVVFLLSRSKGNRISYTGLEQIKDGLFFSSKYESEMCIFNPPHVIVFANVMPEVSQLSSDRWVIRCLDKEGDPFSFANRKKAYMESSGKLQEAIEIPTLEEVAELD